MNFGQALRDARIAAHSTKSLYGVFFIDLVNYWSYKPLPECPSDRDITIIYPSGTAYDIFKEEHENPHIQE